MGGYSNPSLTDLIGKIRGELDNSRRDALIREGLSKARAGIANLRLSHQEIAWAARRDIAVKIRPDTPLEAKWVTVH